MFRLCSRVFRQHRLRRVANTAANPGWARIVATVRVTVANVLLLQPILRMTLRPRPLSHNRPTPKLQLRTTRPRLRRRYTIRKLRPLSPRPVIQRLQLLNLHLETQKLRRQNQRLRPLCRAQRGPSRGLVAAPTSLSSPPPGPTPVLWVVLRPCVVRVKAWRTALVSAIRLAPRGIRLRPIARGTRIS